MTKPLKGEYIWTSKESIYVPWHITARNENPNCQLTSSSEIHVNYLPICQHPSFHYSFLLTRVVLSNHQVSKHSMQTSYENWVLESTKNIKGHNWCTHTMTTNLWIRQLQSLFIIICCIGWCISTIYIKPLLNFHSTLAHKWLIRMKRKKREKQQTQQILRKKRNQVQEIPCWWFKMITQVWRKESDVS